MYLKKKVESKTGIFPATTQEGLPKKCYLYTLDSCKGEHRMDSMCQTTNLGNTSDASWHRE